MTTLPIGLKGYFIDKRDGRLYHTVVMPDGREWMTENLAYDCGDGCSAYGNDPANIDKYGRLYTWDAAIKAVPDGWRLPDDNDWDNLVSATGGSNASRNLKSKSDWNSGGNGTDQYGFSALPGGYRYTDGSFNDVGNWGFWWSATEYDAGFARYRLMSWNYVFVLEYWYGKSGGFSVRCLRDNA